MAYQSDEKSAFKKFFNENKLLVYMLPIVVVLVVVLIIIYSGNLTKNVAASSDETESQSPAPQESQKPEEPQVEVLPQIVRQGSEQAGTVTKDPFDAPMMLKGIIYSAKNSSAIVEWGGISYILQADDTIGNSQWQVAGIKNDSLEIKSGEKSEILKLTDAKSSDGTIDTDENILSMNIQNADIRDVLSAVGICMDKNIIFAGQPAQVNYAIQQAKTADALNYLLKTLGMAFIENDSTLIVGTRETLNNDFFNNIALTRFTLKYLSSDVIAAQIDSLGIPVKKVTLDSNKNAIWVQGLPQELGKVRELISLLDKADNVSGQATTLMLTPLELTYITADQMKNVLSEMGIQAGMILDSNPNTLWIYGSNSLIAQISEIRKKVDIAENSQRNSIFLTPKKLNYLTTAEIGDILTKMNANVGVVTFDRRLQTLWLTGNDENVKLASSIIDTFDVSENINYNLFFVHKFTNLTAKEGKKRFDELGIEGVKTYAIEFPELSKSIMVFCPSDYKQTVINNLSQLDVVTERIKVPIDYSDSASGAYKLQLRRDLIVSMTGIPSSSFTISGNVSRDDTYHFILYLEETSEVVQRVKDLITYIDDPLKQGSVN